MNKSPSRATLIAAHLADVRIYIVFSETRHDGILFYRPFVFANIFNYFIKITHQNELQNLHFVSLMIKDAKDSILTQYCLKQTAQKSQNPRMTTRPSNSSPSDDNTDRAELHLWWKS